jgi:hypothetical protein
LNNEDTFDDIETKKRKVEKWGLEMNC